MSTESKQVSLGQDYHRFVIPDSDSLVSSPASRLNSARRSFDGDIFPSKWSWDHCNKHFKRSHEDLERKPDYAGHDDLLEGMDHPRAGPVPLDQNEDVPHGEDDVEDASGGDEYGDPGDEERCQASNRCTYPVV